MFSGTPSKYDVDFARGVFGVAAFGGDFVVSGHGVAGDGVVELARFQEVEGDEFPAQGDEGPDEIKHAPIIKPCFLSII
ncbi:MAG: hypothetical protein JXA33_28045 [Anaerolineae bacterium]|nr:hypothetical protein [Anaerolineae bacterium]